MSSDLLSLELSARTVARRAGVRVSTSTSHATLVSRRACDGWSQPQQRLSSPLGHATRFFAFPARTAPGCARSPSSHRGIGSTKRCRGHALSQRVALADRPGHRDDRRCTTAVHGHPIERRDAIARHLRRATAMQHESRFAQQSRRPRRCSEEEVPRMAPTRAAHMSP